MKPSLCFLLIGLTRRHGESVCAATMAMGFPGYVSRSATHPLMIPPDRRRTFHFFPTAKATSEEALRVR